mmetsp:Transcript_2761/g.6594  ORF Transcript_2761/g.6594 Transcript_2761/m.6594 type:complete len:238 (-) Transcript_2761:1319-2032(-)
MPRKASKHSDEREGRVTCERPPRAETKNGSKKIPHRCACSVLSCLVLSCLVLYCLIGTCVLFPPGPHAELLLLVPTQEPAGEGLVATPGHALDLQVVAYLGGFGSHLRLAALGDGGIALDAGVGNANLEVGQRREDVAGDGEGVLVGSSPGHVLLLVALVVEQGRLVAEEDVVDGVFDPLLIQAHRDGASVLAEDADAVLVVGGRKARDTVGLDDLDISCADLFGGSGCTGGRCGSG